ncbi:unknown [Clostridium sp. CAG:448]|nr:unknown [Clostridium sp. CAG:448]
MTGKLLLMNSLSRRGTEIKVRIGMFRQLPQHFLHARDYPAENPVVADIRKQRASFLISGPIRIRGLEHSLYTVVRVIESPFIRLNSLPQFFTKRIKRLSLFRHQPKSSVQL